MLRSVYMVYFYCFSEKLNFMNLLFYMFLIVVVVLFFVVFMMEFNVWDVVMLFVMEYKFMWVLFLFNLLMVYGVNLCNFLVTKYMSVLTF